MHASIAHVDRVRLRLASLPGHCDSFCVACVSCWEWIQANRRTHSMCTEPVHRAGDTRGLTASLCHVLQSLCCRPTVCSHSQTDGMHISRATMCGSAPMRPCILLLLCSILLLSCSSGSLFAAAATSDYVVLPSSIETCVAAVPRWGAVYAGGVTFVSCASTTTADVSIVATDAFGTFVPVATKAQCPSPGVMTYSAASDALFVACGNGGAGFVLRISAQTRTLTQLPGCAGLLRAEEDELTRALYLLCDGATDTVMGYNLTTAGTPTPVSLLSFTECPHPSSLAIEWGRRLYVSCFTSATVSKTIQAPLARSMMDQPVRTTPEVMLYDCGPSALVYVNRVRTDQNAVWFACSDLLWSGGYTSGGSSFFNGWAYLRLRTGSGTYDYETAVATDLHMANSTGTLRLYVTFAPAVKRPAAWAIEVSGRYVSYESPLQLTRGNECDAPIARSYATEPNAPLFSYVCASTQGGQHVMHTGPPPLSVIGIPRFLYFGTDSTAFSVNVSASLGSNVQVAVSGGRTDAAGASWTISPSSFSFVSAGTSQWGSLLTRASIGAGSEGTGTIVFSLAQVNGASPCASCFRAAVMRSVYIKAQGTISMPALAPISFAKGSCNLFVNFSRTTEDYMSNGYETFRLVPTFSGLSRVDQISSTYGIGLPARSDKGSNGWNWPDMPWCASSLCTVTVTWSWQAQTNQAPFVLPGPMSTTLRNQTTITIYNSLTNDFSMSFPVSSTTAPGQMALITSDPAVVDTTWIVYTISGCSPSFVNGPVNVLLKAGATRHNFSITTPATPNNCFMKVSFNPPSSLTNPPLIDGYAQYSTPVAQRSVTIYTPGTISIGLPSRPLFVGEMLVVSLTPSMPVDIGFTFTVSSSDASMGLPLSFTFSAGRMSSTNFSLVAPRDPSASFTLHFARDTSPSATTPHFLPPPDRLVTLQPQHKLYFVLPEFVVVNTPWTVQLRSTNASLFDFNVVLKATDGRDLYPGGVTLSIAPSSTPVARTISLMPVSTTAGRLCLSLVATVYQPQFSMPVPEESCVNVVANAPSFVVTQPSVYWTTSSPSSEFGSYSLGIAPSMPPTTSTTVTVVIRHDSTSATTSTVLTFAAGDMQVQQVPLLPAPPANCGSTYCGQWTVAFTSITPSTQFSSVPVTVTALPRASLAVSGLPTRLLLAQRSGEITLTPTSVGSAPIVRTREHEGCSCRVNIVVDGAGGTVEPASLVFSTASMEAKSFIFTAPQQSLGAAGTVSTLRFIYSGADTDRWRTGLPGTLNITIDPRPIINVLPAPPASLWPGTSLLLSLAPSAAPDVDLVYNLQTQAFGTNISVTPAQVTLPAGSTVPVSFTLSVPAGASSGLIRLLFANTSISAFPTPATLPFVVRAGGFAVAGLPSNGTLRANRTPLTLTITPTDALPFDNSGNSATTTLQIAQRLNGGAPTTSSVSWTSGQMQAQTVTLPISAAGTVSLSCAVAANGAASELDSMLHAPADVSLLVTRAPLQLTGWPRELLPNSAYALALTLPEMPLQAITASFALSSSLGGALNGIRLDRSSVSYTGLTSGAVNVLVDQNAPVQNVTLSVTLTNDAGAQFVSTLQMSALVVSSRGFAVSAPCCTLFAGGSGLAFYVRPVFMPRNTITLRMVVTTTQGLAVGSISGNVDSLVFTGGSASPQQFTLAATGTNVGELTVTFTSDDSSFVPPAPLVLRVEKFGWRLQSVPTAPIVVGTGPVTLQIAPSHPVPAFALVGSTVTASEVLNSAAGTALPTSSARIIGPASWTWSQLDASARSFDVLASVAGNVYIDGSAPRAILQVVAAPLILSQLPETLTGGATSPKIALALPPGVVPTGPISVSISCDTIGVSVSPSVIVFPLGSLQVREFVLRAQVELPSASLRLSFAITGVDTRQVGPPLAVAPIRVLGFPSWFVSGLGSSPSVYTTQRLATQVALTPSSAPDIDIRVQLVSFGVRTEPTELLFPANSLSPQSFSIIGGTKVGAANVSFVSGDASLASPRFLLPPVLRLQVQARSFIFNDDTTGSLLTIGQYVGLTQGNPWMLRVTPTTAASDELSLTPLVWGNDKSLLVSSPPTLTWEAGSTTPQVVTLTLLSQLRVTVGSSYVTGGVNLTLSGAGGGQFATLPTWPLSASLLDLTLGGDWAPGASNLVVQPGATATVSISADSRIGLQQAQSYGLTGYPLGVGSPEASYLTVAPASFVLPAAPPGTASSVSFTVTAAPDTPAGYMVLSDAQSRSSQQYRDNVFFSKSILVPGIKLLYTTMPSSQLRLKDGSTVLPTKILTISAQPQGTVSVPLILGIQTAVSGQATASTSVSTMSWTPGQTISQTFTLTLGPEEGGVDLSFTVPSGASNTPAFPVPSPVHFDVRRISITAVAAASSIDVGSSSSIVLTPDFLVPYNVLATGGMISITATATQAGSGEVRFATTGTNTATFGWQSLSAQPRTVSFTAIRAGTVDIQFTLSSSSLSSTLFVQPAPVSIDIAATTVPQVLLSNVPASMEAGSTSWIGCVASPAPSAALSISVTVGGPAAAGLTVEPSSFMLSANMPSINILLTVASTAPVAGAVGLTFSSNDASWQMPTAVSVQITNIQPNPQPNPTSSTGSNTGSTGGNNPSPPPPTRAADSAARVSFYFVGMPLASFDATWRTRFRNLVASDLPTRVERLTTSVSGGAVQSMADPPAIPAAAAERVTITLDIAAADWSLVGAQADEAASVLAARFVLHYGNPSSALMQDSVMASADQSTPPQALIDCGGGDYRASCDANTGDEKSSGLSMLALGVGIAVCVVVLVLVVLLVVWCYRRRAAKTDMARLRLASLGGEAGGPHGHIGHMASDRMEAGTLSDWSSSHAAAAFAHPQSDSGAAHTELAVMSGGFSQIE